MTSRYQMARGPGPSGKPQDLRASELRRRDRWSGLRGRVTLPTSTGTMTIASQERTSSRTPGHNNVGSRCGGVWQLVAVSVRPNKPATLDRRKGAACPNDGDGA